MVVVLKVNGVSSHVYMPGASDLNDTEKGRVAPFFSNVDKDIFVLVNLPEVIKGTLFSRYSRSDKSARRLLLDEFLQNKDISDLIGGSSNPSSALNVGRAEDFYQRILVGYGDDSVAELAGAHIACENVSSLAADYLTDSRIGISPLEKSARYVLFDKKADGKYLWYAEPKIMGSKYGERYAALMDSLFSTYSEWLPVVMQYIRDVSPKSTDTSERAYESATRAKACDVLKNILPASRLTNVGIFGNGRALEYLLSKLHSSGLAEVRSIADEMHVELAKVIPAFVKRAEANPYLLSVNKSILEFAAKIKPDYSSRETYVRLADYDKNAEQKVIASMLYPHASIGMAALIDKASNMDAEERQAIVDAYLAGRRHRRDRPGRALEHSFYTFEICANYGMFRDLHRHRIMTQEHQRLTAHLGFDTPVELMEMGLSEDFKNLLSEAKSLFSEMEPEMPYEAQYCVPRAFRMRWYMKLNLREIYHLTELRSSKQGHPDYRKLAQEMKRLVAEVHPSLTGNMFVDMNDYALPRLESEKRIDYKLSLLEKKENREANK